MATTKPSEENLREAANLERIIDGKEYVVISSQPQGREFSLIIPRERFYTTPRYKVLWRVLKLMLRAVWSDLQ